MALVISPSTRDAVVQLGQPYVLRLSAGSTRAMSARMLRLIPVSANPIPLPTATMKTNLALVQLLEPRLLRNVATEFGVKPLSSLAASTTIQSSSFANLLIHQHPLLPSFMCISWTSLIFCCTQKSQDSGWVVCLPPVPMAHETTKVSQSLPNLRRYHDDTTDIV